MKTHENKLVRDRIPELLAERGVPFEARTASNAELPGLLLAKLDEEIAEYLAAADDLARVEELADVLEVVVGLGGLCGADRDSLENLRARKAEERGAFEAHVVLISTGAADESRA
jgi:predicted house-cleaning noncanonical NTP pyrophosphatase (MazG superfamily)